MSSTRRALAEFSARACSFRIGDLRAPGIPGEETGDRSGKACSTTSSCCRSRGRPPDAGFHEGAETTGDQAIPAVQLWSNALPWRASPKLGDLARASHEVELVVARRPSRYWTRHWRPSSSSPNRRSAGRCDLDCSDSSRRASGSSMRRYSAIDLVSPGLAGLAGERRCIRCEPTLRVSAWKVGFAASKDGRVPCCDALRRIPSRGRAAWQQGVLRAPPEAACLWANHRRC